MKNLMFIVLLLLACLPPEQALAQNKKQKSGKSLSLGEQHRQTYIRIGREMQAETKNKDCDAIAPFIKSIIYMYDTTKGIDQKTMVLQELGKISCPEVINFYESIITNDTSEDIRSHAMLYLGWIDATSSIPFLLEYAKKPGLSDYELVRIGTTLTVMEDYKNAEPLLNKYCFNTEKRFCEECIWAYYKIGNGFAKKYYRYIIENSKDSSDILCSAKRLAELGDFKTTFPIFKHFLNSPDRYSRSGALDGLGLIEDKKSLELIDQMQNDSSDEVQRTLRDIYERRRKSESKKNTYLNQSLQAPKSVQTNYDPQKVVLTDPSLINQI